MCVTCTQISLFYCCATLVFRISTHSDQLLNERMKRGKDGGKEVFLDFILCRFVKSEFSQMKYYSEMCQTKIGVSENGKYSIQYSNVSKCSKLLSAAGYL